MVDREPSIGRYVVAKSPSTSFFPWFERAGKITKIAGQRIYYVGDDGKEGYMHDFEVVCDTPAEVSALMEFTAYAQKEHFKLLQRLQENKTTLLSTLGGPTKEKAKPPTMSEAMETAKAAPRIRRVRK